MHKGRAPVLPRSAHTRYCLGTLLSSAHLYDAPYSVTDTKAYE
jgi:hypothetical protein